MKLGFLLSLVLLTDLTIRLQAQPFSSSPLLKFNPQYGQASIVTVATDNSMIVVGFLPSQLIGFDIQGNQIVKFQPNNYTQIEQLMWVQTVGPMIVGSGNFYLWSSDGTLLSYKRARPETPIECIGTANFDNPVISILINGNNPVIIEYQVVNSIFLTINQDSLIFNQEYNLPNIPIESFMYVPEQQYIIISTGESPTLAPSQVLIYSYLSGYFLSSSGNQVFAVPYYVLGGFYISYFANYTDDSVLMVSTSNQIFTVDFETSETSKETTYSVTPIVSIITGCPGTNYFAISSSQTANNSLVIYDQDSSNQLEPLQSINKNVIAMACSSQYLVYIDSGNYITVRTYNQDPDSGAFVQFPAWVIAIIVVLWVFFLAVVGMFVYVFCKNKNKEKTEDLELKLELEMAMYQVTVKDNLINSPNNVTDGEIISKIQSNQYQTGSPNQNSNLLPNPYHNQYQSPNYSHQKPYQCMSPFPNKPVQSSNQNQDQAPFPHKSDEKQQFTNQYQPQKAQMSIQHKTKQKDPQPKFKIQNQEFANVQKKVAQIQLGKNDQAHQNNEAEVNQAHQNNEAEVNLETDNQNPIKNQMKPSQATNFQNLQDDQ